MEIRALIALSVARCFAPITNVRRLPAVAHSTNPVKTMTIAARAYAAPIRAVSAVVSLLARVSLKEPPAELRATVVR